MNHKVENAAAQWHHDHRSTRGSAPTFQRARQSPNAQTESRVGKGYLALARESDWAFVRPPDSLFSELRSRRTPWPHDRWRNRPWTRKRVHGFPKWWAPKPGQGVRLPFCPFAHSTLTPPTRGPSHSHSHSRRPRTSAPGHKSKYLSATNRATAASKTRADTLLLAAPDTSIGSRHQQDT
jgi:hypothetical protein